MLFPHLLLLLGLVRIVEYCTGIFLSMGLENSLQRRLAVNLTGIYHCIVQFEMLLKSYCEFTSTVPQCCSLT